MTIVMISEVNIIGSVTNFWICIVLIFNINTSSLIGGVGPVLFCNDVVLKAKASPVNILHTQFEQVIR